MFSLDTLLLDAMGTQKDVVSDHVGFRRSHQLLDCGNGTKVDLLCDESLHHGLSIIHARFRCQQPGELNVSVEGAEKAAHERGYLAPHPAGGSIWLPAPPVTRRYDSHGRIEIEQPGYLEYRAASGTLGLRARAGTGDVVDVPFVHAHGDGDRLAFEINSTQPVERIKLKQDDWYEVDDVSQLWKYLIHGRVHDPRWQRVGKRIECQQCAHTWHSHLGYLHRHTGKRIYGALQDAIAYSVLLSLPGDHRWRHGEWTDTMETHTRFQTDGIHLLLQHYAQCHNEAFLSAACDAADYLISIADPLDDDGVWYRHDTLELDTDPEKAGYPQKRRSNAFGKDFSNTLCLNTHAWTLTALWRLAHICHGDRRHTYQQAFTRGMHALHTVLAADVGDALYGGIYRVRDACLRLRARAGFAMPLRLCDAILHRALRRLKPRLPRLAMPNGYIERDLERSTLSDRYVPVNLKDLALLSRLTGCEWLRPIVTRGMSHWISSGLWRKELARSATAQQTLDAALLLAAEDASYHGIAQRIYRDMCGAGRAVTLDSLAGIAGDDGWTLHRIMPDAMKDVLAAATNNEPDVATPQTR